MLFYGLEKKLNLKKPMDEISLFDTFDHRNVNYLCTTHGIAICVFGGIKFRENNMVVKITFYFRRNVIVISHPTN
jgi:hypothetical protein